MTLFSSESVITIDDVRDLLEDPVQSAQRETYWTFSRPKSFHSPYNVREICRSSTANTFADVFLIKNLVYLNWRLKSVEIMDFIDVNIFWG